MTISSTNRKAGPYAGNDVATAFPFSFKVFSASDLYVVRADSTGTETVLALTADYTVVLNSNQDTNPGGTITLPSALASGYTLTIASQMQYLQPTDLINQGGFYPKVITNALDRLTIFVQQLSEAISRSLKTAISTPLGVSSQLPAPVPYALIGWNAAGDGFQNTDPTYSSALASDLANVSDKYKGVALVAGAGRVLDSIATLRTMPKTGTPRVFLTGYYAAGDGGGGHYYYDGADTASADDGGSVIVASDGGRWKLVFSGTLDVRQFGADPTGASDATTAIQNAINALPARGGIVRIPSGTFKITSSLVIGDGNGAANASTKNGVKLIGEGAGFAVSGSLVPTIFNYAGTSTTDPLLNIKGKISDIEVKGLFLACNALCAGIAAMSFSGSKFEELKIINPKAGSAALSIQGGGSPTGNYNVFNTFSRINIALLSASSIGLYMDGNYAVQNDTWISKFDLVRIETVAGATNAVCAWFKFVDSCTFHRCHIDASPEPTALGAVFDALANNNFPAGMAFHDCSIDKTTVYEDGSHVIRKNYFYGFGTYDGEGVPTHANLCGITDTGVAFGGFLYNEAWNAYTPTITAQSGAFTAVSATGRWKQVGKLVFIELAITITTNGTAAGGIRATLPSAPGNVAGNDYFGSGRNTSQGTMVFAQFSAGSQTAFLKKVDDTYPGATGAVLKISGMYEVA